MTSSRLQDGQVGAVVLLWWRCVRKKADAIPISTDHISSQLFASLDPALGTTSSRVFHALCLLHYIGSSIITHIFISCVLGHVLGNLRDPSSCVLIDVDTFLSGIQSRILQHNLYRDYIVKPLGPSIPRLSSKRFLLLRDLLGSYYISS